MSRFRRTLSMAALSLFAAGCTKDLVCNTGETVCDGQCVNLSVDPENCSTCGHACGNGETCQAGLCCQGGLCPAGIYVACFESGEVQGATVSPIAPVGVAANVPYVTSLAWSATSSILWAVPGYEESGAYALSTGLSGLTTAGQVPIPVVSSAGLTYVAANGSLLYVSDDDTNSVVVIGPATTTPGIVGDVANLPSGFSPYGIAFSGNTGYVALVNYTTGSSQIAVFDVASQEVTGAIDMSTLGNKPGGAQPQRLLVAGNRLYVTLQNLDPTNQYAPAGDGLLAVVDTSANALVPGVNPVDLGGSCQDPYGLALYGNKLYVTCGFLPFTGSGVQGAGVVPVDVSGPAPLVLPAISTAGLTPAPFFAPGPIAFCGDFGYIGDQQFGYVLRLDPSASASLTASQVPLCNAGPLGGSYVGLNDIHCAP